MIPLPVQILLPSTCRTSHPVTISSLIPVPMSPWIIIYRLRRYSLPQQRICEGKKELVYSKHAPLPHYYSNKQPATRNECIGWTPQPSQPASDKIFFCDCFHIQITTSSESVLSIFYIHPLIIGSYLIFCTTVGQDGGDWGCVVMSYSNYFVLSKGFN